MKCEQPFTITISTILAQTNNEKERWNELERESAITTKNNDSERERERNREGKGERGERKGEILAFVVALLDRSISGAMH